MTENGHIFPPPFNAFEKRFSGVSTGLRDHSVPVTPYGGGGVLSIPYRNRHAQACKSVLLQHISPIMEICRNNATALFDAYE